MAKEQKKQDETQIKIGGRFSFPYLFKKDQYDRYSIAVIIDPQADSENPKVISGKDAVEKIERAITVAAKAKWPGKDKDGNPKYKKILKKLYKTGKVCFAEGDDDREEYEGMMVLRASNVQKPKARNKAGNEDVTAEDGVLYSGCHGIIVADIWAQDNDFGQRINCSLRGVQAWKDGEAFAGGGVAEDDDFDDLADGADDEDDEDEDEKPKKKKKRSRDDDDEDDDLA